MGLPEVNPAIKELLQKKVHLFEMLLDCAKQQSELSYPEHSVEYDNIIETRAGIIEELQKTEIILNHNLEVKAINQGDLDEQLKAINHQVAAIIGQIMNEDTKSQASIMQELQNVKGKLQVIQKGKKGMSAYGANIGLNLGGAYTDSKR
jgi:hypothetical protein